MTDDEKAWGLGIAGALGLGFVAWVTRSRPAEAAPAPRVAPSTRAPQAVQAHGYVATPQGGPPPMSTGFLASAPPPGEARELYFERAAEPPEWVDVVLSPALTLRVSRDVVRGGRVRLPLWPTTAQRIADRFDAMLPTERLSDAIWRAGTVKVEPHPMTPRAGADRDSNTLLAEHEALVNAAVAGRAGLIVGAKKDVIVGASVPRTPGKVFIYGWHHLNGTPIQPVYGGHSSRYSDYSHGARLVSRTALVHGVRTPIESVFADPATAALVSKTGTLGPSALRYPTA